MPLLTYFIIIFIIVLIGAVTTVMVGFSKKNKEGNPEYDQKTGKYWLRLTLYYVIAFSLGFLALFLYIRNK